MKYSHAVPCSAFLLLLLANLSTAFRLAAPRRHVVFLQTKTSTTTALNLNHCQEFERAIECAAETGLCKDDELIQLADGLEKCVGCLMDDDCEQEMVDRQDVADILRMDAALQLRLVYLNNANLFKERVEEARDNGKLGPVMEQMERAIECACKPGLCKVEELNTLADEIGAYKGCLNEEDGDQEKVDRQDVVDILRMDAALQLRQVYLQNVNLFRERVLENRDKAATS